MRDKLFVRLGWVSMIIGILYCGNYLFSHYFLAYFSSVGIKEWLSPFCLFVILIISGFLLILKKERGLLFMRSFIFGIVIERIIAFIMFNEYVIYFEFIFPIVIGLSFGYFNFFSKYSKYLQYENYNKLTGVLIFTILFLIIFPKIYFM